MNWPKTCSCGSSFTREAWNQLKLKGVQASHGKESFEVKNCPACSSTLLVPVSPKKKK